MYGISSLLVRGARLYPDKMAAADCEKQRSYGALNVRVNKIANYLLSKGFTKGSRVGFICDNCVEFVEMWLATQKIGLVAVMFNFRAGTEELARDVRRAACDVLFYSPKWQQTIAARDRTGSPVRLYLSFGGSEAADHVNLERICEECPEAEPEAELRETDWSCILFTSGSTGLAKGVVRTHRMTMEYAMQMAAEHEFYRTEPVCILSHSPLFHTGGLSMLLKALALGGSYIGINGLRGETVGRLIEQYKATQLFLVPPVNIMRLAADEEFKRHDLSSINFIWATGGKLSAEYVQKMLELFPGARIKTSYGGTEFCAACSISYCLEPQEVQAKHRLLDSAGVVGLFCEVRLVDEEGNDAAPGELGEIWVRSPFVMLEYLDDPQETAQVLSDGWYRTGDVFRMDENGYLYFADRKSAMIKSGGENIYPNEVEMVLRDCPGVQDCAVLACPDEKWGEAVAAAIVPDARGFILEQLKAYAAENLAGFRKPRYYLVVDELPKTGSGKTDRKALGNREKYTFAPLEYDTEKE